MSAKLLPCPFCGDAEGELAESAVPTIEHKQKLAVFCNGCFCEGPPTESATEALAAWNRRAPAPAGEAPATVTIQREVFDRLACGHGFMLDEECDWPSCSFNEVRDALRAAGRKG